MSDTDPTAKLFQAIDLSGLPGMGAHAASIDAACAAGADPNAPAPDGDTPLTRAIRAGTGNPKAVERLLKLGADPSRRDGNGWTPWAACLAALDNPVTAHRMERIRALLESAGADRSDAPGLALERAAAAGDRAQAEALIASGVDPDARPFGPLDAAVSNGDLEMARLLLHHGAHPDGRDPTRPPLVAAAEAGRLDLVQLLAEAGADPRRFAYHDPECTPAFLARVHGHAAVADWLDALADESGAPGARGQPSARVPPEKLAVLYAKRTNGINFGLTTEAIAERLADWDARFGIELSEVEHDRLTLRFLSLPEDLDGLAAELAEFCPDLVEEHFDAVDEILRTDRAAGRTPDPGLVALLDGIDPQDPRLGERLLARSLKLTGRAGLWWD